MLKLKAVVCCTLFMLSIHVQANGMAELGRAIISPILQGTADIGGGKLGELVVNQDESEFANQRLRRSLTIIAAGCAQVSESSSTEDADAHKAACYSSAVESLIDGESLSPTVRKMCSVLETIEDEAREACIGAALEAADSYDQRGEE